MDEPTSFLDVRHKLELLSILSTMAKEKQITVIMSLHEIDLAEKVSDKILCVKGECDFPLRPCRRRSSGRKSIRELYEIDNGSFDPCFGSIELPRILGEPQVLVLSACGTGIPVYRRLQKEQIPFAAAILYDERSGLPAGQGSGVKSRFRDPVSGDQRPGIFGGTEAGSVL